MNGPVRIVTDASVWIDLHDGGLVAQMFGMDFELIAPDVVIAEIEEPSGSELVARGLASKELSAVQIVEAQQLRSQNTSLSMPDAFACVLARASGTILLTGDRRLRAVAEHLGIRVHGTLWLVHRMVRARVLSPQWAVKALELMRAAGSRFPQDAYQRLLRRLSGD